MPATTSDLLGRSKWLLQILSNLQLLLCVILLAHCLSTPSNLKKFHPLSLIFLTWILVFCLVVIVILLICRRFLSKGGVFIMPLSLVSALAVSPLVALVICF
ncbi:hypothetical protein ALO82_200233 [Pseudomonas syringae pv. broussonetiae]|uniref:Uncharacterized protein n=1 Tax=Pseudomonas savastanoi TaxID=29438 RepID=A0A3M5KIX7_PSESS|nr:hypothetical protein ALO82_200233 [Pseudomonas syringae pv. broussonetiae]RMT34796.1 hypothetical protein ALP51_200112 [Pseudomonas savastanoi]